MRLFQFPDQLVEQVLQYLQTKPFTEVNGLIQAIMQEVNLQNQPNPKVGETSDDKKPNKKWN